jgi:RNA polymerase sigma-70 factor (ECF subfamily)
MSSFDDNSPDGLLISAALAGDEDAFTLLVRRYEGALLNAAQSRLGKRQLAEEAVQEALLCVHRWLATYDSRYSFRTWLWTILLNQCSRLARRESKFDTRQQSVPSEERSSARSPQPAARSGNPVEQLIAQEARQRLDELLARLPVPQADALRLRFFGRLTFPEIAAAMQCSEAGAKQRVKAGLLKLSQWIADVECSDHQRAAGEKIKP